MSTATFTLEDRKTATLNNLLADEQNVWASLDSSYDRGLRAGQAQALRDHLGLVLAAAQSHIARRPHDREAISTFVAKLQGVLVNEVEGEADPFEFDGGLGI